MVMTNDKQQQKTIFPLYLFSEEFLLKFMQGLCMDIGFAYPSFDIERVHNHQKVY